MTAGRRAPVALAICATVATGALAAMLDGRALADPAGPQREGPPTNLVSGPPSRDHARLDAVFAHLKLDRLLWQLQAQASAAAITATQEGIQLHGGMGMSAEMPLGDYYKRVLLLQSLFGSYELALDRLADTLDFQHEVA